VLAASPEGVGAGSSEPPAQLAVGQSTGGGCQPGWIPGRLCRDPFSWGELLVRRGAGGMHRGGWNKLAEGWCGAQGGSSPRADSKPSSAGWKAAPQNPPACGRRQLLGTIPTPRPSLGRRGFWLFSGGCEGGEHRGRGGTGSLPRHRSLPSPKSSIAGQGGCGEPDHPLQPGCNADAAGVPSEGTIPLSPQLPGWLHAAGIRPPRPPMPQPRFQLRQVPRHPHRPGPWEGSAGMEGSPWRLCGPPTPGPWQAAAGGGG